MEAADVEREIEGARQKTETRHVGDVERAAHACPPCAISGLRDGPSGEVDADGLPAVFRQVDDVRAGPAAKVERAPRRVRRHEAHELRWRDAGVPRRPPQPVPDSEQQPPHAGEPSGRSVPPRDRLEPASSRRALRNGDRRRRAIARIR